MADILDLRQIKINSGECAPLYYARMERAEAGGSTHCFLCRAVLGNGEREIKNAYRKTAGEDIWLCGKCFADFRETLSMTEKNQNGAENI
ncbi:MAG: hypothetical protein IJQ53_07340 [Clostridia bacterium]|nr:hypothetical protein [Clostridia bacterium]